MSKGKQSLYTKLVNRFSHLAANASEDEDERRKAEERKAREEGDDEEDEEEAGISEDEKKARQARNEKRRAKGGKEPCPTSEDDDEDEDSPEGKAAAKARAAERERWGAVLSSPEAKGRVPLACSLLAESGMHPDKIRAVLQAAPLEARQGLAQRMAAVPRPEIGSGPAATPPDAASPNGQAALMRAAYDKAIGRAPEAR